MSKRSWFLVSMVVLGFSFGVRGALPSHAAPQPILKPVSSCPEAEVRAAIKRYKNWRPSRHHAHNTRQVDALARRHGKRFEDHDLEGLQLQRDRRNKSGARHPALLERERRRAALRQQLDAMGCGHMQIPSFWR